MTQILDPDYEDLPVSQGRVLRLIDHTAHEELEQATEEFLARGGKITVLSAEVCPVNRAADKRKFNPGPDK